MIKRLLQIKHLGNILNWILNHKKISLILFIILAVVIYFLFPKGGKTVLTSIVSKKDIIKTVSVTGKTSAESSVDLTFQTSETLSYVGVKPGDYVKKGQVIASLDQEKLQANLRQAQQDFVAAKAASDQYYSGNTNATESYDQKVKRTALDATQNKAYDQMLKVQRDIRNSTLYATIDGIITRMDVQNTGVNITAATTFTITDPTSLNFKMEVDEADIGQVEKGQDINVSLDTFPNDTLKLSVDKIDFVSHKASSGGDAFYVEALLPKSNNYRVGISGNADIVVGLQHNVLSVPSSSVVDNTYVYVKTDKGFKKTNVKLGLQGDIEAEITSGLSEGETVAIDPGSVPQKLIIK